MADTLFDRVNEVIEKDIKHFIEADGGYINLNRVEDGIVYVTLAGACATCPAASMTLRGGVERILKSKIDEILAVEMGE
jgi:Fe-S cluster biogenesis protein NfuA